MQTQEFTNHYAAICGHLAARRLKPAFDRLGQLIPGYGMGMFYDEYKSLEETYRFMLKYTVEGIPDPERQTVYRKLIVSSYELADKVYAAVRLKFSPSYEEEKMRTFRSGFIADPGAFVIRLEEQFIQYADIPEEGGSLPGGTDLLQSVRRLFYHVWFTDRVSPQESDPLLTFIKSSVIPLPYRSLMVSALMLSLQRFFDPRKFNLLFEAFRTDQKEIVQRALIGLIINLSRYDSRLPFFPEITGRLIILNEDPDFRKNVEHIIRQLIRSRETEKLVKRIRDEILPEMIRISPILKDKINLESLMEEGLGEDKNPDWEEIFGDSPGLLNKMAEFSELQLEGADVFMGSFAMLKNYPFFHEASNWFISFFAGHPEISGTKGTENETILTLVKAMEMNPLLCNSDKYSFFLSIKMLPEENIKFLSGVIRAEVEQLEEQAGDDSWLDPGKAAEFKSNQYIQDLFRFYKLFPRKADFEDIFDWKFDFHNQFVVGNILREDPKILRNIAEYYFSREYFDEASEIFGFLLDQEKSGDVYQKIAYCFQQTGNYQKALDHYLKAELFNTKQVWNLKKIALCYRNLKQTAKALEYYREAEKLDPEDLSTHLNIGHCLLELGEFDEALKSYFRVEYLAPGNKKVWRPIAWCSFLTGKKEQAENYFIKLLEEGPGRHDFMNMGHLQWSLGNRKAALEFYSRALSKEGFTLEGFLEVFEEDLPHLLRQGIDEDDVPIMLDQLRYLLGG
jgi:tetratricopeptide (TPR) repeat protein